MDPPGKQSEKRMSSILVTGGAGFIGSHLSEKLVAEGHKVIVVDNFHPFYDPAIKRKNIEGLLKEENFSLREGDIRDMDFLRHVFQGGDLQTVIHFAAMAGVRPSLQQPSLYFEVNIGGTVNILELARTFGVQKVLFASSSSVYGQNQKVPFHEDDRVDHPVSPYGASKRAGEIACSTYHHLYGISISCIRFFTVYGPRQRPEMAIHKFVRQVAGGEEVPLYGDGHSFRDYTYISDAVDGVLRMIRHSGGFRVYNIGESRTVELCHLVRLIEKLLGKKAKIRMLPVQPGDVPRTFADITRAKEELGYSPKVSIEEGLEIFIDWYFKEGPGNRDRS